MPFHIDNQLVEDARRVFGEYLTTFMSQREQVRADIFRRGGVVTAHVSFPTGLEAVTVTDPYVNELWNYARENGFPDQFKVVLS